MAGIATVLSMALPVLFSLEHISVINLHPAGFVLQCTVPITGVAVYCHWAGRAKLRDGCFMVMVACVFFNLLQLPQYAAARTGLPLTDAVLMKLDLALGVNGGLIMAFVHQHPLLEAFSIRCYGLMPLLVFASILAPAIGGKLSRMKEYLLASTLAALLGACVFAIFPAAGPWTAYHFEPYWNQTWFGRELAALRTSGPFTANPEYTCGLITFPSFHIALAVLGVFALWPFRWIRFFALLVAALIAIATVTTGWHYACDGIGGIFLALGSVAISKRFLTPRL